MSQLICVFTAYYLLCFSALCVTLLSFHSSYMSLIRILQERRTDRISQLLSAWSRPVTAHGLVSEKSNFIGQWTTYSKLPLGPVPISDPVDCGQKSHWIKKYDSFCLSRHSEYHAQYTEWIMGRVIQSLRHR